MVKFGITERGDPSLDFSWIDKLLDENIIITKNLSDKMIETVCQHQNKIILHVTCTGYGKTKLEPNVPEIIQTRNQTLKLIKAGFPISHIVLRTDPIIPTELGLDRTTNVLIAFKNTGIKRVRYSFLDMYAHVKQRFIDNNLNLPYETFCAPQCLINNCIEMMKKFEDIYSFESCAEYTKHQTGCISQRDFDVLGIKELAEPAGFQRKGCMCIAGKTELLNNCKKCPHGCLYCYWKD